MVKEVKASKDRLAPIKNMHGTVNGVGEQTKYVSFLFHAAFATQ